MGILLLVAAKIGFVTADRFLKVRWSNRLVLARPEHPDNFRELDGDVSLRFRILVDEPSIVAVHKVFC